MAGKLNFNQPPPEGIGELEDDALAPGVAGALGIKKSAPLMRLENLYEAGVKKSQEAVKPYTTFPESVPVVGGWSPVAAAMPETLPGLAALFAAAPEYKFIGAAERPVTSYGLRLLEKALPTIMGAGAGGLTAGLTGKDVGESALAGGFTGAFGTGQQYFAKKLIGREGSPYIEQLFRRQTGDVGSVFNKYLPNLFNRPMKNAADLRDAFSNDFKDLPWIQSLKARYPKGFPKPLQDTLDRLQKGYDFMQKFFTEPESYGETGSAISPLKLQQWLLKNKADIPLPKPVVDDLIRAVFRVKEPSMAGFDVLPESGRVGARVHYVPRAEGISPLTPIFHYGFGKSGEFIGATPELTPSTAKRLFSRYLAEQFGFSLTEPTDTDAMKAAETDLDLTHYPSPVAVPETAPTPRR